MLGPGAKVRVVAGEFSGLRSPIDVPTDVDMFDISLEAGAELSIPLDPGRSAFVLPVFGSISVDGQTFGLELLQAPAYPAQRAHREIRPLAPNGAAKVMVFGGTPFNAETI